MRTPSAQQSVPLVTVCPLNSSGEVNSLGAGLKTVNPSGCSLARLVSSG